MQFLYHPEAGASRLVLEGERYRYLFRIRRFRAETPVYLRHLRDSLIFTYRTVSLDRRRAEIVLEASRDLPVEPSRFLHLGWCAVDPKNVERILPLLNETGVGAVTFIRCSRSQKQFFPEMDRLRRILINSCQQCGRSSLMELGEAESLEDFLARNPETALLDFSDTVLPCGSGGPMKLVIGPEGGVSAEERALFSPEKIFGFGTPTVLRSESAAAAAAARILLG